MDLKAYVLDISRWGLKQMGLAPLALHLIRYLPLKIKKSIKHHLHKGHKSKLVPEKELEIEYRKALAYLGRNAASGDYLEFGVFYGASLACMYRAATNSGWDQLRLFGFDSFDGLPEKSAKDPKDWDVGDYKADLEDTKRFLAEAQVDMSRVVLTKGWFTDTLTDELVRKYNISRASLIMIDCDLYSSAKRALDFCAPLIRDETIIFFDDWEPGVGLAGKNKGEVLAFEEFLAENPALRAKEFSTYYDNQLASKVFLVTRKASC